MKQNYIGITGFTSPKQVTDTINSIKKLNNNTYYMFGYLVSGVILNGGTTKNKRYFQFKKINEFKKLIQKSANNPNILNMIHYSSREKEWSTEIITLLDSVIDVCHTIQLNLNNPSIEEIKKVKEAHPKVEFLYSVTGSLLSKYSNEELYTIIKDTYKGYIDYILIDPSGGAGKIIDIQEATELFNILKPLEISTGIAGGFTPENLPNILSDINSKLSQNSYSIDIESGVRKKLSDKYGDDMFNQRKVDDFLKVIDTYY